MNKLDPRSPAFARWLARTFAPFVKARYLGFLAGRPDLFARAFTPAFADPARNYEDLELLGDAAASFVIPMYFYNRFPHLRDAEGVKIIARLKILWASGRAFAEFARQLGLEPWIRLDNAPVLHAQAREALLEDVFEAFLGATVLALDGHFSLVGVGISVVYDLLAALLNRADVRLDREALFDPKTRLKEVFDVHGRVLGPLRYEVADGGRTTRLFAGRELLAVAEGPIKKDREQEAASRALAALAARGYARAGAPLRRPTPAAGPGK